MNGVISAFVEGFPDFLIQVSAAGLMLIVASTLYILLTPWKEFALIRAGNSAAGVALAGAIVGLTMPLASALASSEGVMDLAVWGSVSLLLQLLVYRLVDMLLRDIPKRIEADEAGAAIVLVAAKLSSSMILAAGLWIPNIPR